MWRISVLVVTVSLSAWGSARAQQDEFTRKREKLLRPTTDSPDATRNRVPTLDGPHARLAILQHQVAEARRTAELVEARAALMKAEVQLIEAKIHLLRLEIRESLAQARPGTTPGTAPHFLDQELSFEPPKGSGAMLSVEDVQSASVPFPETIVIDQPAALERFLVREKQIKRPVRTIECGR